MKPEVASVVEILDRLVGFRTISAKPNLDFIHFVETRLREHGLTPHLSHDETGQRANIHALIGPTLDGGVALNGHTDVVPANPSEWMSDPFGLRLSDGRAYGRGAVDMKGFLACMLAAIPIWQKQNLKKPIHISMCFDEEIGGFGAPILVQDMIDKGPRPSVAIVGEPTGMGVVNGHKGAFEMTTTFAGSAAHASDPRKGANSVYLAARFINYLEQLAAELAAEPLRESAYDPPFATISVGTVSGGSARNIVPSFCEIDWELRPISIAQGEILIKRIRNFANDVLLPDFLTSNPGADIQFETKAKVPPLNREHSDAAVKLLVGLTGVNATSAVPFGTDAGHFCKAGISTAVFGPGSIEQAHKSDEFIELSELSACLDFFGKLGERLSE